MGDDDQIQVTFEFAGAWEVHYMQVVPDVGDLVTHDDALWVVRSVEPDELGLVVICEIAVRRPD